MSTVHPANGKRVYVAGPLGEEHNWPLNIHNAVKAWEELMKLGYFPYCPHVTAHLRDYSIWCKNMTYDDWMAYDIAWLDACDYLLRLPGHSPGADQEVKYANDHHIPVFHSISGLLWYKVLEY